MLSIVPVPSLVALSRALRRAWSPETCAPEDRARWSADNPARGQCITTVLIVHDYSGASLVRGEVIVGGERVDFHWWNRLPDGTDVDLTRDQFGLDEQVVGAELVERPTGRHRVEAQYELLRQRVTAELDAAHETA